MICGGAQIPAFRAAALPRLISTKLCFARALAQLAPGAAARKMGRGTKVTRRCYHFAFSLYLPEGDEMRQRILVTRADAFS